MMDQIKILNEAKETLSFKNITDTIMKSAPAGMMDQVDSLSGGITDMFMEQLGGMVDMEDTGLKDLFGSVLPEEVKNFLGFDSTPELKDAETPDTMGPHMPTETQQRVDVQNQQAADASSRSINNPSAENQGVIKDMSKATTPNADPENSVYAMQASIKSPPAHRTNFL